MRLQPSCLVLTGLVFGFLAGGSALGQTGPKPDPARSPAGTSYTVKWDDSSIEEAMQSISRTAEGFPNLLCDSYDDDSPHHPNPGLTGSMRDIAYFLGRTYQRTVWECGGLYLLQSNRWFESPSPRANSRSTARRAHSLKIDLIRSQPEKAEETKSAHRLQVRASRASLGAVVEGISEALQEPHVVGSGLRERLITGYFERSPAQFREDLTSLMPDTEWVRQQTGWLVRLRRDSALLRELAARIAPPPNASPDQRLKAALGLEVLARVPSDQLQRLSATGNLRLNWSQLGSRAQGMLLQGAELHQQSLQAAGSGQGQWLDLSNRSAMGIWIRGRQDGSLHLSGLSRDGTGTLTVW